MEYYKSKCINPINKEAVHRICSGQVVLNLATAVKELVENSLDAGATVIEIKLREYGSELIEITDNGSGVEPNNFQGLTLKHHTSKLQDFSDLVSVETFGFRGEALSSLCSLSNLTVTTRHASCTCGTRLLFDHNGHISSSSPLARQVGTTVCLENLFSTLPVRQKEFHRNLKREFTKMCTLLYAYCLVSTGIKISCTNQTKKGGRMTVVSTQGCQTVKENIACVFGSKQLSSLLEVKTVPPVSEDLEQLGLKEIDGVQVEYDLEGLVSSCAHGLGRSSNDRQFYYVNSRPCEPAKVMKAVNEVFHQYNMHQQPFVYLNIRSARDFVDVNVTPDKRQVFMEHEKLLVATVKASLQALYENIPSTYTINQIPSNILKGPPPSQSSQSSPAAIPSQLHHKTVSKRHILDQYSPKSPKQAKLDLHLTKKEKITTILNRSTKDSIPRSSGNQEAHKLNAGSHDLFNLGATNKVEEFMQAANSDKASNIVDGNSRAVDCNFPITVVTENTKDRTEREPDNDICRSTVEFHDNPHKLSDICDVKLTQQLDSNQASPLYKSIRATVFSNPNNNITPQSTCVSKTSSLPSFVNDFQPLSFDVSKSIPQSSCEAYIDLKAVDCQSDETEISVSPRCKTKCVGEDRYKHSVEVCVTITNLQDLVGQLCEREALRREGQVRFRAIIDPSKNKLAEQELSREISKHMFVKMEVIGQFNLGFIIAKLNSDLFIVDQHATDEKYNFETLQKTTVISKQKLVVPQQLELTAVNEAVLIDNLDIFNLNGFEFEIIENGVQRNVSITFMKWKWL